MKSSMMKNKVLLKDGPMFNAYPDSIGGKLQEVISIFKLDEFKDAFESFYILPSVFNSDLDRGFSIIDYNLNEVMANTDDLNALKSLGISLKFDFVLNHLSVLSKQFQDIINKGADSEYTNFFINWNTFWQGKGQPDEFGVIKPYEVYIQDMFFRKPSLPILNVKYPNGQEAPYWNTFYQKVNYSKVDKLDLVRILGMQYGKAEQVADLINGSIEEGLSPSEIDFSNFDDIRSDLVDYLESKRTYLGQMDLNIKSPLVWDFYRDTLKKLAGYGARIVRLDAFAYAPKEPGKRNFFNEPDTWDFLASIEEEAHQFGLNLLPEIHTRYEEKMHEKISEKGFLTYDFFLPGLLIDAFERNTKETLIKWIEDIQKKDIKTVNMLGCHDGIPLLDLKGLLTDVQIEKLIKTLVDRGGYVKDLHGKENMYYQVNATYFSALGENEQKLLLARAIQIFMPGIPQVWYLDLFAGSNDYEAMEKAGVGGHKEINRSNLSVEQLKAKLKEPVVKEQLNLLKLRNTCKAFGFDSNLTVHDTDAGYLKLTWEKNDVSATLEADLHNYTYKIIVE